MSELPEGVSPAAEPTPRDSAAAVLVTGDGRVLLGLRSRKASFMPGHLSFPGGLVEGGDGADDRARFVACVTRELREETGLELPPAAWVPAGERTTPPLFPVRFLTRFFVARLPEAAVPRAASEENETFEIVAAQDVVGRWERGECLLPPPVLAILRAMTRLHDFEPTALAAEIAEANAVEDRSPRIEFVPGIWVLPVRTETLPPATHTNAWLPGGRRFAIVDPASGEPAEQQRLLSIVERRRTELGHEPSLVILTHGHRDHIAGALPCARALNLPIAAHAATLEALRRGAADVQLRALDEGDPIDLDGSTLEVMHTPGHAAGHIALRATPQRALIVGDLISGLSTILIDPEHGDMDAYLSSLERARAAGCRTLLPGHGPPLPAHALERLIAHRAAREARDRAGRLRRGRGTARRADRRSNAVAPEAAREARPRPARGSRGAKLVRCMTTAELIEERLRERFSPEHLELEDESWRHAGHAGAAGGGGHFQLVLVASAFEGLPRIAQQRLVHRALDDLMRDRIHALTMRTYSPSEWRNRSLP